jgi:hypothetical protein
MQNINLVAKTSAIALLATVSIVATAFAGCRTENRFNEFTRTWSTNNVCDFGTLPAGNTWSFTSAPNYVPAPLYVAPSYAAPSFTWNFPSWVFSPVSDYVEPVYTLPVTVDSVPVYQDSGILQTPVDVWDNGASSWVPGWIEEPVDRFTDVCGDFFESW